MSNLFRTEVVNKKARAVDGNILLSTPLSLTITTFVFCIFVITSLTLAFQLTYSQKQTLAGNISISPDNVSISPSYEGTISTLNVKNGDRVDVGDVIAIVRQEKSTGTGENITLRTINTLRNNIQNIKGSFDAQRSELLVSTKQLNEEIELIQLKQESQRNTIALFERQLELEKKGFLRAKSSFTSNHISKQEFNQAEKALIIAERQLEKERALLIDFQQRTVDINSKLSQLTFNQKKLEFDTKSQISSINERIETLQFQYEQSLTASTKGTIQGLTKTKGEYIGNNQTLVTIAPDNSVIYVDLFAPTSLSSPVNVGDEVKVYVAAFPYQEYGFLTGSVALIDPQIIMPNNAQHQTSINTPSYRIRLTLSSLDTSQGHTLSLKSGMAVNSDLITKKQTVISWLLEPLKNIKEKY